MVEEKDKFAVWIADAVLRASDEEFAAAALAAVAKKAEGGSLDAALAPKAPQQKRPGDFGLEIVGSALSVILIEFGRALWDSYTKSLADGAGKTLGEATVSGVKKLLRQTWAGQPDAPALDQVEHKLREAAARAKLDAPTTERLISGLRSQETAQTIADG